MKLLIIGGSRSLSWANKIGYFNQFLKIVAVPCIGKPEDRLTAMDKRKGRISLESIIENNSFTHVLAIGELGCEQSRGLKANVFHLKGKRNKEAIIGVITWIGLARAKK